MSKFERCVPSPHYLRANGELIHFNEQSFEYYILDGPFNRSELQKFKKGGFTYALYIRDAIPFLFINFEKFGVEIVFNAHELIAEQSFEWLSDFKRECSIVIIEAESLVLQAFRNIVLDVRLVLHLKSCLKNQLQEYKNEYEVNERIDQIMDQISCNTMIEACKFYKCTW